MAGRELFLTQDIGLFSCKAALFSTDGTLVKTNAIRYSPESNHLGWAWQSHRLWWNAFCQNCRILLAGVDAKEVKGVCLCGQMMGCMPVDESVQPLYEHITWDDCRSAHEVCRIEKLLGNETIHRITGVCLGQPFSLPKILWLMEHHPDVYRGTYRFITCKDYVNYKLTGDLCTDETCAGFTQLYDLYGRCWSDRILDTFGIDRNKLPEVVRAGRILGTLTPEAAAQTGLCPGTPVVQGMGDGRAPAVGAGILSPGEAYINLGSCSWISQCTRSRNFDATHSITKAAYLEPDLYVNGGTTLAGRICIDWYLNAFSDSDAAGPNDLERFLKEHLSNSPVGSRGLLFMPYLRGDRAPWWSSSAGGGFIGLSARHTRHDLCRSILEGVAFQLLRIKNRIEALEPFGSIRLVGSAAFPVWQQILSDVLEAEIVSFDHPSLIGCVGSALICGVALGKFRDYSEAARFQHNQVITLPIAQNVKIYRELFPAFEDCYYALADINRHLGQL